MRGRPRKNRKRDMKILKKRRGLFEDSLWRRGCSRLHSVSKKWQKATFSSFFSVFLSRSLPDGKRCNGRNPKGHHPFRRGAVVFGAGALVTAVTLLFLPEDVVWFGVLTLLGSSMLLTAALDPLLRRVPPAVGVAVSALLFWVTYPTMNGFWNLPGGRLALPQALYASYTTAYLGFMPKSFFSTDYFPLLPWLFLFWAGYFLHHLVGRGRLAPLRRSVCPPLGWMGRHSLVLYLLHQPVILGVLTVAFRLVRAG